MHHIVARGPRAGLILSGPAPEGEEALECDGGAYEPGAYPELADCLYLYPKGRLPDLRELKTY